MVSDAVIAFGAIFWDYPFRLPKALYKKAPTVNILNKLDY